jgi:hypothetical protein
VLGLEGQTRPPRRAPTPIWPENAESAEAFFALETQWRGGALDYAAIPGVLEMLGVKRKRRRRVFLDLRVMEHAAREAGK